MSSSLVAYGSSDESSDEEEVSPAGNGAQREIGAASLSTRREFDDDARRLSFGALPKPMTIVPACSVRETIEDDILTLAESKQPLRDDDIPLFEPKLYVPEIKPAKKRISARISIPSLSDFKDVDEEVGKRKARPTTDPTCSQRSRLVAILPPPKGAVLLSTKKNNFVPHCLTRPAAKKPAAVTKVAENPLSTLGYDSDSNSDNDDDDDDDDAGDRDFFALSNPVTAPASAIATDSSFSTSISEDKRNEIPTIGDDENEREDIDDNLVREKTLVSTVMNMPREEIMLKNKAEVGPKLPVPEQEYNVDSQGNVAFDDKAIEYLCGKRGVKRKDRTMEEANIIEINGEDIKPDEREWLVKALTEEPAQRPISMIQGAGPSSQSKKKHQITYLAHQAKAMEVELKNTWSQNRMTRKQTQSKYGF